MDIICGWHDSKQFDDYSNCEQAVFKSCVFDKSTLKQCCLLECTSNQALLQHSRCADSQFDLVISLKNNVFDHCTFKQLIIGYDDSTYIACIAELILDHKGREIPFKLMNGISNIAMKKKIIPRQCDCA